VPTLPPPPQCAWLVNSHHPLFVVTTDCKQNMLSVLPTGWSTLSNLTRVDLSHNQVNTQQPNPKSRSTPHDLCNRLAADTRVCVCGAVRAIPASAGRASEPRRA
jgi:hypothetical protein